MKENILDCFTSLFSNFQAWKKRVIIKLLLLLCICFIIGLHGVESWRAHLRAATQHSVNVFWVKDWTLGLETHLEGSTVLKPPGSSASFPNLRLCFRGSCRPSAMGQVTWERVCSVCLAGGGGFSEQAGKHYKCVTCWCAAGAGWPGSSHGWSPAELWPGTLGRRWTEVWLAGCSPALPGASPGLKRRGKIWVIADKWKRHRKGIEDGNPQEREGYIHLKPRLWCHRWRCLIYKRDAG